jgi:hypothetical protein
LYGLTEIQSLILSNSFLSTSSVISLRKKNRSYGIKKIKENLFILFIESKGILATLARLATNDWVVITEDNHVDKIPEENFDKIITLVD